MNTSKYLWEIAASKPRKALPILSFPAVQKMGVTVKALTSDSRLQAECMKLVAQLTPAAASVSLMDLSVEAEAFGATVRFSDNEVPTITGQLVSDEDEAKALKVPAVGDARTGLYVEAIRLAKQMITDRPVLAGCIGPYSLAGRLLDVTEIMYMCYDEPETVETVLNKATDFLIQYIRAFQAAGADGVVIAEPLAGLLSPNMNAEFSYPYMKRIIESVRSESFAVIYHNCGNSANKLLREIFAMNADGYHFGDAVDMREIMKNAPEGALCMGNISPAGQFAGGTPESIREATLTLMRDLDGYKNYIVSSGCDIPPHAKWENIDAFFRAVADCKPL